MIRRAHSYVIAAAIWGIPGINIAVKGFRTYMLMNPDVPTSFTASFYSGLGPMLIVGGLRYVIKPIEK